MHPSSDALAEVKKVRLGLELTEDINGFLEEESEQSGISKGEVLRKAIALMKTASLAKQKGWQLAFIDPKTEKVVGYIVGL